MIAHPRARVLARARASSARTRARVPRAHALASPTRARVVSGGSPRPHAALTSSRAARTALHALPRAAGVNMKWMVEAELKHCRLAMLATAGWLAVDFGARFPGSEYSAVPNALAAHDFGVAKGDLVMLLLIVTALETVSLFATMQMLKGETDRKPGQFYFDPLGFGKGDMAKLQLNEISNGRLAMIAFSGIVTQAAITKGGFPYM